MAGFVFMIAILVAVFVQSNIYYLVISVVGALLFSAYLLFDLQVRQPFDTPAPIELLHMFAPGQRCAACLKTLPISTNNIAPCS